MNYLIDESTKENKSKAKPSDSLCLNRRIAMISPLTNSSY